MLSNIGNGHKYKRKFSSFDFSDIPKNRKGRSRGIEFF